MAGIKGAAHELPPPLRAPYEALIERFEERLAHIELVRTTIYPPLRITAFEQISLLEVLRQGIQNA